MVYDRTHTRDLSELGPMHLARLIPFAAVTFAIASMASIGLPGFSGFVAEFEILIGAWRAFPTLAMMAGAGILIGIAFTWRALDKAFFGEGPAAERVTVQCPRISLAERMGAAILIAATLVAGVYPRLLLDLIIPALNSPLFDGLRKGVWR
jgi:NADH-quinone oxidoreductase subunit M